MLGASLWLVVQALGPALAAVPPAAPPSLEVALARHGPAVVAVHDRQGAARPGFFVSSSGVAVTVLAADDDIVVELASGERRRARVLVRDADGLALVEVVRLEKDALFPSLGLSSSRGAPSSREWLLGLDVVEGKPMPTVGGLRRVEAAGRWLLDLPLAAGAPVLRGADVIGVVVARDGRTASVAVSAERIRALVKQLRSSEDRLH